MKIIFDKDINFSDDTVLGLIGKSYIEKQCINFFNKVQTELENDVKIEKVLIHDIDAVIRSFRFSEAPRVTKFLFDPFDWGDEAIEEFLDSKQEFGLLVNTCNVTLSNGMNFDINEEGTKAYISDCFYEKDGKVNEESVEWVASFINIEVEEALES